MVVFEKLLGTQIENVSDLLVLSESEDLVLVGCRDGSVFLGKFDPVGRELAVLGRVQVENILPIKF